MWNEERFTSTSKTDSSYCFQGHSPEEPMTLRLTFGSLCKFVTGAKEFFEGGVVTNLNPFKQYDGKVCVVGNVKVANLNPFKQRDIKNVMESGGVANLNAFRQLDWDNGKFLLVGVVALLAVAERVWFDLGANVELVTSVSILSGMYLRGSYKFLVPLGVMYVSDLVLGMGMISLFTWSGFVVMVYLSSLLRRIESLFWRGLGSGVLGNLVFFGWTNFGVWLTEKYGMYTNDLSGLMMSYWRGLPFLRLQLVSTLLFLPVLILLVEEVLALVKMRRLNELL